MKLSVEAVANSVDRANPVLVAGCRDQYGIYRFRNRQEFVIAEKTDD